MAMLRRLILRDGGSLGQRAPPPASPTPSHPSARRSNTSLLSELPRETGPLVHLEGCAVTAVLDLDYLSRHAQRHSCEIQLDRLHQLLAARAMRLSAFAVTFRNDLPARLCESSAWTIVEERSAQSAQRGDWRTPLALHALYLAGWTDPAVLVIGTSDFHLRRTITSASRVHATAIQVYSMSLSVRSARGRPSIPPRDRWHISLGRDVLTTL